MSGRPLHRAYAERAGRVGGELVDTVANVWAVKAFSARERERGRLAGLFGAEAGAQARSWLHLERTRVVHDLALWVDGRPHAGLGRPPLVRGPRHARRGGDGERAHLPHPARLARPGAGAGRDDPAVRHHRRGPAGGRAAARRPRPPRRRGRFVPAGGAIEFRDVTFAHPGGGRVFAGLRLRIPAGQKVGLAGPSGRRQVDAGRRSSSGSTTSAGGRSCSTASP